MFYMATLTKGDTASLDEEIRCMAEVCAKIRIDLVFVFDGMVEKMKKEECLQRQQQKVKEVLKFFMEPHSVYDLSINIPRGFARVLRYTLLKYNFTCVRAYSEADPVIVEEYIKRNGYGVVTNDSDFLLSVVNVFFTHSDFMKTLLWCYNKLETLNPKRVLFRGIAKSDVIKALSIRKCYFPLFSCLCGNDFTKGMARKLRRILGIPEGEDTINDVTDYFRATKDSPDDIIEVLRRRLNEGEYMQLSMAILEAERMMRIIKVQHEEIPLSKEQYPNCTYSFSTIIDSFTVPVLIPSYNIPSYSSSVAVAKPLRALIYSVFHEGKVIKEYYYDKIDSPVKNEEGCEMTVPKAVEHYKDPISWINRIPYTPEARAFILSCFEKGLPMEKTVYAMALLFISNNTDEFPSLKTLAYEWYHLMMSPHTASRRGRKPKSMKKNSHCDHRIPVHQFGYFHYVVFCLNEILIDFCNVQNDYIIPLFNPSVTRYCISYNADTPSIDQLVDKLRKEDDFFNQLSEVLDINKHHKTLLLPKAVPRKLYPEIPPCNITTALTELRDTLNKEDDSLQVVFIVPTNANALSVNSEIEKLNDQSIHYHCFSSNTRTSGDHFPPKRVAVAIGTPERINNLIQGKLDASSVKVVYMIPTQTYKEQYIRLQRHLPTTLVYKTFTLG